MLVSKVDEKFMKNHSVEIRVRDLVLGVLIALCLVLAFVPRPGRLQFFIPESSQSYGNTDRVLSVTADMDGRERTGKEGKTATDDACIEVSLGSKQADSVTVTSENESIGAYYYWGVQWIKYFDTDSLSSYAEKSFSHPENEYFTDMTLPELVAKYADKMLIFSVKGNGKTGFTEEMDAALKSVGITTTPLDGKVNDSYVAYAYDGKTYSYVGRESDTHYESINGHRFYMTSAGIYDGNRSSILIDGKNVSGNRNGLNVMVYDPDEGKLIDSVTYNTNSTDVTMTRNDEAFYTVYSTVINSSFLEQLQVRYDQVAAVFRMVYLAGAAALIVLWLDLRNMDRVLSSGKPMKTWTLVLKQIPVLLFMTLPGLMWVGYQYLIAEFSDVSIDQLIFHTNTNLNGTNWGDFKDLFIELGTVGGILLGIGIVLLLIFIHLKKNPEKGKWTVRIRWIYGLRWATVIAGIVVGAIVIDSFWWRYSVYDYLTNQNINAEVFDEYYVDPSTASITFPEEKKNLIYIFMESMEISAADESVGGGKTFNAIPELTDLALANNCFNGSSSTTLNGGIPLTNGTWTIAGIVSQTSGLPLKLSNSFSNKRGNISEFLPGATTLGDILEKQGYNQEFLLGSDAEFGNRAEYFTQHGDYTIHDYYYAKNQGLIPWNYFVWWGYEDAKLFEFAKDDATQLASQDEPFNLTILTVDTHFTNGWLCEDCPDTYADQYSNVLACSSKKVSEFVQWVQQQPWGKDTVIVLSGDHLCMDDNYYSDMPEGYQRKTYVNIINGAKEKPAEKRTFATIDLFPTTLSALGADIEGDRLGLGTDLYSDTETLLELKGKDYMDNQFSMHSDFYNENILYGNP